MQNIDNALLELPAELVTRDQDILSSYLTDFRRQYTGATTALLRPRHTADVQTIIRVCAKHRVGIVPQGGNTSYCTAATPNADGRELLISLEKMNRLRDLDKENLSVTADAGMILADLQRAADEAGLLLPLALGSQQSCRLGGNLSTNAGGINVVRYGMTRDLVLGLEAVLPDGSIYSELNPLRKNNSGYDVKQLFIGAEGTLGIITGVSLKLMRKSCQTITAFLAVRDISSLSAILNAAQIQSGEAITSFEYISSASLNLLLTAKKHLRHPLPDESEHYVVLEAATVSPILNLEECMNALLAELLESGMIGDGTIAASQQQRAALWYLRESIPEAEVHHGGSVKHDIAVRTSRLSAFIESASRLVKKHRDDAILSIYGHVGDGNVHFNIVPPIGIDQNAFKDRVEREISPEIYQLAFEMGGTFSAEYGIGRVKLDLLRRYGAEGKTHIMERIKTAIDPRGILNPGKVIP
ncbi:FAD-binding oxidoreductase [Rhizobium chutanense]|uniref:Dehydrogenase n=1 Tax=Rhizobium chutanense TaxID=2035448 RepID=A0A2A6JD19_9HYPH|nr:FAD-binding oxidoreductase [Rhizobium chutanense]PDT04134.1 dehydrogenase [Rhizobium chutanense]RUM03866.1 FAD-binding oxidoreductase [Rhizobium chutanense]